MKKVISILLAVVLIFSGVVFASAKTGTTLQFDENGQFKILVLADIQSGYPVGEALKAYIAEAIDASEPDLVVFLGDNIMGSDDKSEERYWMGYDEVLTILEDKNVPFTLVFGNHDDESMPTITKEEMLRKYQSFNGCLAYDADPSLHGCATHNLPILSSDGTKIAYNLWMIDCGDYVFNEDGSKNGYDCVRADQIEWYKQTSENLQALNGGEVVPSMAFQHIVTQEAPQAVMFSLPFQLGAITRNFSDGTSATYLPNYFAFEGLLGEAPCPSLENEGQWDAFVERGDVVACFFGHDHKNNFSVNVNGVDAVSVPGTTFRSYRSVTEQGGLLITLDESDLSSYSTENLYTSELAVKEGSNIPNQEHSESVINYKFRTFARFLAHGILDVLRGLFARIPVPYTVK